MLKGRVGDEVREREKCRLVVGLWQLREGVEKPRCGAYNRALRPYVTWRTCYCSPREEGRTPLRIGAVSTIQWKKLEKYTRDLNGIDTYVFDIPSTNARKLLPIISRFSKNAASHGDEHCVDQRVHPVPAASDSKNRVAQAVARQAQNQLEMSMN